MIASLVTTDSHLPDKASIRADADQLYRISASHFHRLTLLALCSLEVESKTLSSAWKLCCLLAIPGTHLHSLQRRTQSCFHLRRQTQPLTSV